jgi:ABC-type transport system involved in Fe-S cluster assembly fused permease/ATPase subunit
VKYFGAEIARGRRYDRLMARYEDASVKTHTWPRCSTPAGAIIFTFTATMLMCATGVRTAPIRSCISS